MTRGARGGAGVFVPMVVDGKALRAEALRVHARYAREIVEALGFCPWAAGARAAGRVHTRVLPGRDLDLEHTLQVIEELASEATADIGLLVFPQSIAGRLEFQHFGARVRERAEQRGGRGRSAFALADFHPDAEPDLSAAERLVAFIRRSPDPTLQLIRRSALDAVRRGQTGGTRFVDASVLGDSDISPQPQPLHERLSHANLATVQRLGVERVTALMEDILRDRDESYARLGLPLPPWRAGMV